MTDTIPMSLAAVADWREDIRTAERARISQLLRGKAEAERFLAKNAKATDADRWRLHLSRAAAFDEAAKLLTEE